MTERFLTPSVSLENKEEAVYGYDLVSFCHHHKQVYQKVVFKVMGIKLIKDDLFCFF